MSCGTTARESDRLCTDLQPGDWAAPSGQAEFHLASRPGLPDFGATIICTYSIVHRSSLARLSVSRTKLMADVGAACLCAEIVRSAFGPLTAVRRRVLPATFPSSSDSAESGLGAAHSWSPRSSTNHPPHALEASPYSGLDSRAGPT